MGQKFGGYFRISVNLLGAYSVVLFGTAFILTKRMFVTNVKRRIWLQDANRTFDARK